MHRELAHLSLTTAVLGLLGTTSPAAGDWPPEGLLLCQSCAPGGMVVFPDASGGAFVTWGDVRGSSSDIYVQRVTASGEIAPGWGPEGVPVCTDPAPQLLTSAAADGQGGVVIAWYDGRNVFSGTTGVDIYAQRILADGTIAPGWPVNGTPVTRAPGTQVFAVVAEDGQGGAYFSWDDQASEDIYVQHLTASGEPHPGWPADGLPVCTAAGPQSGPVLAPDGSGGVILVWGDGRDSVAATYAQRVLADGALASGWPQNGLRMAERFRRRLLPDDEGGAYLSSATAGQIQDSGYYLQRFTGAGTIAPGWPEGGALVASPVEYSRAGLRMVPDGAGGVLLAWYDYRDTFDDEIFVQRMRPDGTLHPGWPVDGLRVTDNDEFDSAPELAPDDQGGAYLAWDRGVCNDCQAVTHHVTGAAGFASGWPANGQAVPGEPRTGEPAVVADGMGGAIVVWEDASSRLRALRLLPDGPTRTLLALVRVEAECDRVRLTWCGAEPGLMVWVERRSEATAWERLSALPADGTGTIRHEDRAVEDGSRYAYRLAYREGSEDRFTSEAWVEVPALRFGLDGTRPNPAVGPLVVALSLASAEPARLALYDLAGREVMVREVGSLGRGAHRLELGWEEGLPAGIYTLVLTQGERRAMARAVVLR